jgi:hypothetical protein
VGGVKYGEVSTPYTLFSIFRGGSGKDMSKTFEFPCAINATTRIHNTCDGDARFGTDDPKSGTPLPIHDIEWNKDVWCHPGVLLNDYSPNL